MKTIEEEIIAFDKEFANRDVEDIPLADVHDWLRAALTRRERAVLEGLREKVENMQFDLTPIGESIEAGMSETEARFVYHHGKGYNSALTDVLDALTPPPEGEALLKEGKE